MPTPEIDAATVPIRHLPIQATTLAGIATPLSGFTVPDSASAQITVILSVSNGVLFADTAPGGIIGGGGSNMIWIAGSAAQVNAKLATLVYVSPKPGADVIAVRVIDSLGHPSAGLSVPLQALPLSNPPAQPAGSVSISGGTITLDTRTIEGLTLNISERQGSTTSPALVLTNSILGAGVRINLVDENGRGETAPRLAIAGRVENDGTASFSGGPALITLAKGAVLTNAGRIEFLGSSAQVSGAGTLQNDGTVAFAGAAAGSPPLIAVAITGAGVISLGGDATVEIAKSVAASQTIRFEDAPRQPESLQLDRPEDVQAQIAGFVSGDQIVLANTRFDAAAYTQADAASGVLTLYDGAAIAARLHFAGSYQLSSFDLLSTGLDSLASSVRITPAFSLEASGHGSLDVYQFLDEALGTQMLTQDAGERDAIVASRHDLVYEGVGFRALYPQTSNPGAVPIYRFFDTTNGAHFFTASDAEKNGTLATRPDLIFEPSSTLYEHATQQAGDVPVFRFFDGAHGTHLYTADAGERAAILSTRIDLKDEGIAFYAPGR
jgi:hypothetical protein